MQLLPLLSMSLFVGVRLESSFAGATAGLENRVSRRAFLVRRRDRRLQLLSQRKEEKGKDARVSTNAISDGSLARKASTGVREARVFA